MTNEKFDALFGGPKRQPEGAFEDRHFHVAASAQKVTEEIILRLARHAREVTGSARLCMAGGVALNCVANGRILREKVFDEIWIQPAAGDAGGALGAAFAVWHGQLARRGDSGRTTQPRDSMKGALLGPACSEPEILRTLEGYGAIYTRLSDSEILARTAELLAAGKIVGWVQGRMEFGPRALGNRSILGDPRAPEMQRILNLKVKKRESFRPFAPAILRERADEYFDFETDSPYMLLVVQVNEKWRRISGARRSGLDQINEVRSIVPAVTHVDYSARVQTVTAENERFHSLLVEFERLTGCPLLVNTSFNIRGEPIVCTPEDAYRCFLRTDMDYLVIENFLLERTAQPRHQFASTQFLD